MVFDNIKANFEFCSHNQCSLELKFLSLGQFYQIWQNWRDSYAKIISLAELSRKSIFFTQSYKVCWANFSKCLANFATIGLNPKRAGGGGWNPPPRHFLKYLSYLLFFRAKTSWLFSFKPCARFKTIFKKIGHRVMKWCCIIACWVQRKTDQKLIFNGNYTQIVCFVFRIHFHYVLSYLFGLFGGRTCVSIFWYTSLPKNSTFAWKNSEKPWFWRFLVIFRVFDMTSLMMSLWRHTRYVCTFFGTNGLGRVIAIH